MVRSDLLLPINDYAQQHGWLDLFSAGLLTRNRWSDEGQFGEGALYGVAPQAEIVGVYYNRALFDQAGIDVPETFEEFEANLTALQEAGITPIVYGGLDGWPGIHLYGAIQHLYVERDYLDDLVYARGGSWVTDENLIAAEKLVEWANAGYFISGFEGIGYDDTWALFAQGQGAMMITGSWITGEIADNPDIGFFAMPPLEAHADTVPLLVGGTGIPLSITVNADDPDLAAEYIDWMVSERAAELWAEAGFIPAMPTPQGIIEEDSLQGQVLEVWDRVNEADAIGHYLDWATPSMYDTITAAIQELMVARITPEQFLEQLETDYQNYLQGQ
jgi:raffinose/stachyose/melibiose transport system substrate-binding protein